MFRPPEFLRLRNVAGNILRPAISLLTAPLSNEGRVYVHALLLEYLAPVWDMRTPFGQIKFYCHGRQAYSLIRKCARKEPDMNAWLSTLPANSVFWDVGANIGIYTLFPAAKGLKVWAFEPEAASYSVLERNLDLNAMHDRVTALNIGLSNRTGIVRFALSNQAAGFAQHKVLGPEEKSDGLYRNVTVYAGRDLSSNLGIPYPNYIKIDVDGVELAVVRGLDLGHSDLQEVMIEVRDNGDVPEIKRLFAEHGFVTDGTLDRVTSGAKKAVNFLFRRR